MATDTDRARTFILEFHDYLVAWINGSTPKDLDAFNKVLPAHANENMQLVLPGGKALSAKDFAGYMSGAYGRNPDFAISIEDIECRHRLGDVLICTYKEWQRNAIDARSNNGRIGTVMLKDLGDDFEILHVHETWLPEEEQDARDYNW